MIIKAFVLVILYYFLFLYPFLNWRHIQIERFKFNIFMFFLLLLKFLTIQYIKMKHNKILNKCIFHPVERTIHFAIYLSLFSLKKSFRLSSSSSNLHDVSQQGSTQPLQIANIPSVPEDQKSPRQEAKCLIQEKDIRFMEVIGKGAFGSVRSAEWTTVDNEKVCFLFIFLHLKTLSDVMIISFVF